MKATFIKEVEVIDPDSNLPVLVAIYKEHAGGMFGVDSSYVEQEIDEIHSPFGNGVIELDDDRESDDSEAKYFRNNTFNGANLD